MQIDDTLVDPHLELVPGLGSLSARSLTGGDTQSLGGQNLNINRDMNLDPSQSALAVVVKN